MAQLQRLRAHLDAHERTFTTVSGLAQFISTLSTTQATTCAIRMCFLRGNHFTTDRFSGTHLEFIDEESSTDFEEIAGMIKVLPQTLIGHEICRLTTWEQFNFDVLQPGVVYEIHHAYGFKRFKDMPEASVAVASVLASVNARFNEAGRGARHDDQLTP